MQRRNLREMTMTDNHDAAVQELLDTFASSWNAHDVEAMTDCWVDGGTVVHPWGHYACGRDAIRSLLRDEHEGEMASSRQQIFSVRTTPLSDGTVSIDCDAALDDVRAPNGRLYRLPHKLSAVAVREGERWRFLSLHPSFVSDHA